MSRARVARALLFVASMVQSSVSAASEAATCDRAGDQIIAYSLDRYVVRSGASAADPGRARFLVRRLGTDEPLDQVACAVTGPCELTAVLGMRGCSYSKVVSGRLAYGLALDASPGAAGPRWVLSVEGGSGRVPVATVSGGALTLKAAVRVGRRVVVILSETSRPPCARTHDSAVVIDEADLREARRRGSDVAGVAPAPRAIALDEAEGDPPPLRTAKPFRAMPVRTVVKAARTAAAAGMGYLAACWITHNASVMSPRDRPALARALADDPVLAPLVPPAHRRRRGRPLQRRAPS